MKRVIYLHGFASSPGSRKAQFFRDRLHRSGFDVEIPELDRGDFEHLTITGQLAVIDEAVRGTDAALMGSSLGGYLAALYASLHPGVNRLVLLAPAFGIARRWRKRTPAKEIEGWERDRYVEIYHYGTKTNRRLRYEFLEDADRYPGEPDFCQPALILHGLNDDVVPVEASREFAAAHPNVRLVVLESGHELLDVLEDMAPMVESFLIPAL
jgi:pimeloyl-ACP methyl ester carboxylesterase